SKTPMRCRPRLASRFQGATRPSRARLSSRPLAREGTEPNAIALPARGRKGRGRDRLPAGSRGRLFPDLRLYRVDLGGGQRADSGDLAVLDLPEAEGAGDVAEFVEADRAYDPFIFDRLALLDELQRLGELVLAGMDDGAVLIDHLADRVLDCCRFAFA